MFESFEVNQLFLANDAVLPIYASGRETGISVASGHSVSYAVPVYEGYSLPYALQQCQISGSDIDDYLYATLPDRSKIQLYGATERQQVRQFKNDLCYVSLDLVNDCLKLRKEPKEYPFSDDAVMNGWNLGSVHEEVVTAPELIFNPCLEEFKEWPIGLHQSVAASVLASDSDSEIYPQLLSSVVLSGGNTGFEGLPQRLQQELQHITQSTPDVPQKYQLDRLECFSAARHPRLGAASPARHLGHRLMEKIGEQLGHARFEDILKPMSSTALAGCQPKVIATPRYERQFCSYIGGRILSALDTFSSMWVNQEVYDEVGPRIVHQMCINS